VIGTGGSGGLTNGTNNNQVGIASPGMGPLSYNGGPTMTHALLVGSLAINAGSNALALDQNGSALTTDQRGTGFPRVFNNSVDIGAYEAGNPIDEASFFVKQHYLDFLNRQPDQSGWDFWTNSITSCGADAHCIEVKRINASAAFFLSIEFQQDRQSRLQDVQGRLCNLSGKPVAVDRAPFLADTRQIQSTPAQVDRRSGQLAGAVGNQQAGICARVCAKAEFPNRCMEARRQANMSAHFLRTWARRLRALKPTPQWPLSGAAETPGRAAALRSVAESNSVAAKVNNEAFVLMQYFGYLQRNPYDPPELTLDYSGYNFWLGKLNQFNGDYIAAEMVKALYFV
jgi:hypothetical protein